MYFSDSFIPFAFCAIQQMFVHYKNSVILYKIENKSAGITTMLWIMMIRVSVLTQQALLFWKYQYFVEHLPTTTILINLWDVLKFNHFIPRMALPWAVDSFTVSLHSTNNGRHWPAVRALQGDCYWPSKPRKFLPVTYARNASHGGVPLTYI